MNPTEIKKIHAMKRYKRRQFLDNLCFYALIAISISLFCCVTLCLPYLSSSLVISVKISGLVPILLSSKLLFIIGNIIILILMFNSRILSSSSDDTSTSTINNVYYDEYINSCQKRTPIKTHLVIKADEEKFEKRVEENYSNKGWLKEIAEAKEEEKTDEGAEEEATSLVGSCSDDLNKRAEDFIARVNRQRRLELTLVHCDSY